MVSIRAVLTGVVAMCTTQLCEAAIYTQTKSGALSFPSSAPILLTFTGTPAANSDALLQLIALTGELAGGSNKRLENLNVEGDTYTTPVTPPLVAGYVLPTTQTQDFYLGPGGGFPDPITIPMADLNGYVSDGQVLVSVTRPSFIAGGTFEMTLSYSTAVPEPTAFGLLAVGCAGLSVRRRARVDATRSSGR